MGHAVAARRPCGTGVDTELTELSTRNIFRALLVSMCRCIGLITLPHFYAEYLITWEPQSWPFQVANGIAVLYTY
jgi:hypothetical protein